MDGGVLAGRFLGWSNLSGVAVVGRDFGGTRFKGYTIAARDVNRRRLSAKADKARAGKKWWDLVKRCDQPV